MIRVVETYNELLAVKQAVIDVKCYGSYETIQERFDVVKNHFNEATNALNRTLMPNSGLRVDLAAVSDFIEDLLRELDEVMDLIILVKSKTNDFIQDCADGETLLELIRAYSYPLPNGMCEYWPEDYLTQAGPTENNVCKLLQSESEISARVFAYKTMALFNMVPQDMLVNFRNEAMRRWTVFEQSRGEWLLDRMHVVHDMELAHRQLQEIIERKSQILGFKWQTLVRVYRDAYQIRMGTSSAAADSKGDLLRHDELKDEIRQAVAEVRENLCKKLVPDEGDDGWRL